MTVYCSSQLIKTSGRCLIEITRQIETELLRSRIRSGIASVFLKHTSASLVLFENADPTAQADLEAFFSRLVPEDFPGFIHTLEGADDMPSHIRMALTRSSETLPVREGRLFLGTWQGLFLYEHRRSPHQREIAITIIGE